MGLTMTFNVAEWANQVEAAHDRVAQAIRPAAQAGAQVLYQAVLRNVQALGTVTGNLQSSIYQKFSADNSVSVDVGGNKSLSSLAVYHVSWNTRKAPHGHLIEYGHIQKYVVYKNKDGEFRTSKRLLKTPKQIPAKPFIRPAMALMPQALAAAEAKFYEVIRGA